MYQGSSKPGSARTDKDYEKYKGKKKVRLTLPMTPSSPSDKEEGEVGYDGEETERDR